MNLCDPKTLGIPRTYWCRPSQRRKGYVSELRSCTSSLCCTSGGMEEDPSSHKFLVQTLDYALGSKLFKAFVQLQWTPAPNFLCD